MLDELHSDRGERTTDEQIDCSVLMPVLNEERHIRASVGAMRKQRFDGSLEFIVIDGGSSDRTREILSEVAAQEPRILILENPRRIAASGLNIGLGNARGRFVARMDAHTEYREDYLRLGIERLGRPDTRWVSGPPIARGSGAISRAVALALRSPLGRGASRKWAAKPSSQAAEYELDAGVFGGVWERQTLLDYGGWDEQWVVNQDSEMAGRFLARDEKLVCLPGMAAYYAPRDSLSGLWRQYLRYGEYREKTAVRHPHTLRRSHLLAPAVTVGAVSATVAPVGLRRLARLGIGAYACALAFAGAVALGEAEMPGDAGWVPLVLATMHLAHGSGFLKGAIRHGAPIAALCQVLGMRQLASQLRPAPQKVFAPSLQPLNPQAETGVTVQ